ncbi:MAG: hypothetical protein RLY61_866 [Candidatus Parcubacteria bacterium]|jgi:uncharacterized protein with HEPN domain
MKNDRLYLEDIVTCIDKIFSYVSNTSEEAFLEDVGVINEAVLLNLINIGEACSKVSLASRTKSPNIPWKKIINLRNIAVHQYYEVDYQQVWQIIECDLQQLKNNVTPLLKDIS